LSCAPLFLVNPLGTIEIHKGITVLGEAQTLLGAETEKALASQGIPKQADDAVLQLPVKIKQDIAAGDELHLTEDCIGNQAVVGKYHTLTQALVEDGRAVVCRVVVGQ